MCKSCPVEKIGSVGHAGTLAISDALAELHVEAGACCVLDAYCRGVAARWSRACGLRVLRVVR
eukprot:4493543-Prymnesium_polylepis.1